MQKKGHQTTRAAIISYYIHNKLRPCPLNGIKNNFLHFHDSFVYVCIQQTLYY